MNEAGGVSNNPGSVSIPHVEHLLDIGRAEEAAMLARQGIAHDPSAAALYRLLAQAEVRLGNADSAVSAATQSVAISPQSAWSYLVLSEAHSAAGRQNDAMVSVNEAVRLAPLSAQPYYWRAIVRMRMPPSFWQQFVYGHSRKDAAGDAMRDLDEAIRLEPENATFHHWRGESLELQGRIEEARRAWLTALEIDPNRASTHAKLTKLNTDWGRFDEARRHVSAALASNPADVAMQRRMRELLRVRLLPPLIAVSVAPGIVELGATVSPTFLHGPGVPAMVAAIGFAIWFVTWWWRRSLSESNRRAFRDGFARRTLRWGACWWLVLLVWAIMLLVFNPFAVSSPEGPVLAPATPLLLTNLTAGVGMLVALGLSKLVGTGAKMLAQAGHRNDPNGPVQRG